MPDEPRAFGHRTRREAIATFGLAGLAGLVPTTRARAADAFPSRPITLVTPFAPGGPSDIVARTVAEKLAEAVKQPVVIENVTGAGGILAVRRVLSGTTDGHQLLLGAAFLATAPHLYKSATFDPVRDLVPLSPPVESLLVFVSGQGGDLKALIQKAKQSGQPIRAASPGAGTLSHLGSEMLARAAGVPVIHAHYRGVGPAVADVIGGHADMLLDGISSSLPLIRDGKLKALAVPDEKRNPLLPDVPSTVELGFADVKVRAWNAIFAPAAVPAPVVEQLSGELMRILARPEVVRDMGARGLEPATITPVAFRQRLASETAYWKALIAAAKISLE